MKELIRSLITPPVFYEDAEKTRLARLLHVILLTVMTLLILFSIPAFVLTPQLGRLLIELTLAGWSIFMLFLLRRGYVRPAAFLMSLTLWVVVSYGTYQSGGFRGSIMSSYFAIVLIAQLLLGTGSGIILGILSVLFTGWLVYAEGAGLLPPKAAFATLPTLWGEFSAVAIGMVIITSLVINSLRDALARARKNEQELAIKVKESQKLTAELSENYALLKSFMRRIGHETRTPLGAILGYAEMMRDEQVTPTQQKQTAHIIDNANQLKILFDGLLDTFQIEAGQLQLLKAEYRLEDLVQAVKTNYAELAKQKNLSLHVEVDPQMPTTIFGDKRKVTQILSNLLLNAIKFTETGGIEICIHKANDAQWEINVSDTGIGIAKDAQGFIFEPFRQADESMTRKYDGIGLGLSVARELTVLMGGSIRVESELGKGSRFTVTLPL